MDEARISEMLERHYRTEAGECADCGCKFDDEDGILLAEWPCDAAVLLKMMGYTLREDPPAADPERVDLFASVRGIEGASNFIPEVWSEDFIERVRRG